jgi:hypothetical protein
MNCAPMGEADDPQRPNIFPTAVGLGPEPGHSGGRLGPILRRALLLLRRPKEGGTAEREGSDLPDQLPRGRVMSRKPLVAFLSLCRNLW